ncbi:TonB family protein [Mesorhizobium sp. KR9-304]|uniref:TonB family protein n=1 Tax=Mesorhizobium sp. KR9-304 TaxID=3156614 RepID=UPI0032B378D2
MAVGLEPAFASARPLWPLAGMAAADFEPDDPDLAIPRGALQNGIREAPERYFAANHNSLITLRPAEPLGPNPTKSMDLGRKWKLALLASCVFHAAIAIFFIQATDEAVLMEGADFSGIALLGSPEDQAKAGETSEIEDTVDVTMVTMLDAVPVDTVDAEPVSVDDAVEASDVTKAVTAEPETLRPVEEPPAEPVTEAAAEPVQPAELAEAVTAERQTAHPTQRTEPETSESKPAPAVTETAPQVLATDRAELVDDDNFVQKPAETQAAEPVAAAETIASDQVQASQPTEADPVESAEVVETAEVAQAEPSQTKPVEATEHTDPAVEAEVRPGAITNKAEPAKPAREAAKKPAAEKKTAKQKSEEGKKVANKADAKPKKSGNRGQNQANAQRGQADGQEKGDSRQASRGGSKNGQVGNAAVSNYPGKVRSKLARVARSVRAKGRGEVVVAFAVGSNGGVRSARVTRSSGVASIDQAALQAIRNASPFPPIPANAGRSSWEFSIPLAFMR